MDSTREEIPTCIPTVRPGAGRALEILAIWLVPSNFKTGVTSGKERLGGGAGRRAKRELKFSDFDDYEASVELIPICLMTYR